MTKKKIIKDKDKNKNKEGKLVQQQERRLYDNKEGYGSTPSRGTALRAPHSPAKHTLARHHKTNHAPQLIAQPTIN